MLLFLIFYNTVLKINPEQKFHKKVTRACVPSDKTEIQYKNNSSYDVEC